MFHVVSFEWKVCRAEATGRGRQRTGFYKGFALRRRTQVRISIPVVRVELGLHSFTQLPHEFIGSLPLRPCQDAPTQEGWQDRAVPPIALGSALHVQSPSSSVCARTPPSLSKGGLGSLQPPYCPCTHKSFIPKIIHKPINFETADYGVLLCVRHIWLRVEGT